MNNSEDNMRNIVIVEASSTGFNFIRDIVNRNYRPVILDMKIEFSEKNKAYKDVVERAYSKIEEDFDLIKEGDSYEETLELVRQYDPLLVIPGSERGVILATKLASDLNLLGNPIENIDAMTLKDKMQEKIAEHGLRHIRGHRIKSVEEAVEYYDEEGLSEVVVKPIYSAGSVGVKICLNKQEMIDSINKLLDDVNIYGDRLTELVIQERIVGEEYFVNTVSCNGDHRVTLIWKYKKTKTDEGGYIYDSIETVNELSIGDADLVEYAYDVADAIGIKYGAVHGEYMVDEKGPVLIEVNCRPSGGDMEAEFLDMISGQHETDSILDAYLNPTNFYFQRDRGYKLFAYGALKLFIVPKDIVAESSPMIHISKRLKSYYGSTDYISKDPKLFVKTQDFETTGGTVYLVNKSEYLLQKDIEFLRSIEKNTFHLVLSDESGKLTSIDENDSYDDVKSLLKSVRPYGSILFVSDQIFDDFDLLQISPDKIDDVHGDFKCVVVNLNESIINKRDDEITYLFLKIIEKVKLGGLIIIPKSTYKYSPHKRLGAEVLIKTLDLKLELPLHHLDKSIIARKLN